MEICREAEFLGVLVFLFSCLPLHISCAALSLTFALSIQVRPEPAGFQNSWQNPYDAQRLFKSSKLVKTNIIPISMKPCTLRRYARHQHQSKHFTSQCSRDRDHIMFLIMLTTIQRENNSNNPWWFRSMKTSVYLPMSSQHQSVKSS